MAPHEKSHFKNLYTLRRFQKSTFNLKILWHLIVDATVLNWVPVLHYIYNLGVKITKLKYIYCICLHYNLFSKNRHLIFKFYEKQYILLHRDLDNINKYYF